MILHKVSQKLKNWLNPSKRTFCCCGNPPGVLRQNNGEEGNRNTEVSLDLPRWMRSDLLFTKGRE